MLSQVERGETSPTLQIAGRIAARAGAQPQPAAAPRRGRQRSRSSAATTPSRLAHAAGHRTEVLTPALPGQRAELSRHTLEPGAATGDADDPPLHEPGAREIAHVERGTVALCIDGERHELHAGDTVTFDADLPHHFENPGPDEAVFLAVVAAGLRRS